MVGFFISLIKAWLVFFFPKITSIGFTNSSLHLAAIDSAFTQNLLISSRVVVFLFSITSLNRKALV